MTIFGYTRQPYYIRQEEYGVNIPVMRYTIINVLLQTWYPIFPVHAILSDNHAHTDNDIYIPELTYLENTIISVLSFHFAEPKNDTYPGIRSKRYQECGHHWIGNILSITTRSGKQKNLNSS